MSALNGDKSRYNRERKEKLARRQRNREMLKGMAVKAKSVDASASSKPRRTAA